MPQVQKTGGIEPLPRYTVPDASAPPYDEILHLLQEYHSSPIGSSYYYILKNKRGTLLCRIVPGGGKVFFHEIVDHEQHNISEDELEEAIIKDPALFSVPGYYPISAHIEDKLRIIAE